LSILSFFLKSRRENSPFKGAEWFSTLKCDTSRIKLARVSIMTLLLVSLLG
jgi:hypothetical protein